jgi:hypothetical protein
MTPADRDRFVANANAALPDRFRVVDEDGVFFLLDPSGQHVTDAEEADDELLERWVSEANALLAQGLYRARRDPSDLPLSWILIALETGDLAASEQESFKAEALRQAKQLETYYERESAARQRMQNRTALCCVGIVVTAWITIGLGPEPHERPRVTTAGEVAFWVCLFVPVVALLALAVRRRFSLADAAIFSALWLIAGASLAVALQVVSGWFFYMR